MYDVGDLVCQRIVQAPPVEQCIIGRASHRSQCDDGVDNTAASFRLWSRTPCFDAAAAAACVAFLFTPRCFEVDNKVCLFILLYYSKIEHSRSDDRRVTSRSIL